MSHPLVVLRTVLAPRHEGSVNEWVGCARTKVLAPCAEETRPHLFQGKHLPPLKHELHSLWGCLLWLSWMQQSSTVVRCSPQLIQLIHKWEFEGQTSLSGEPRKPCPALHGQTRNSDAALSSPHGSPSPHSAGDSSGAVEKSNFSASDLQLKWGYLTRQGNVLIQADQEPESNFYGKRVCFTRQILKANSRIA